MGLGDATAGVRSCLSSMRLETGDVHDGLRHGLVEPGPLLLREIRGNGGLERALACIGNTRRTFSVSPAFRISSGS